MSNSKFKTQNRELILLLALYIALAATYSFVTPLGEGPDEPGHAAYVFFLARVGRLPDQRTNEVPGEGHQPPLAYALAAPAVVWLPHKDRTFDLPGNGRFVWAGGDQLNAVAHGSREFWPWQGNVLAWHLARLVSVVCGAVTVAMTFSAARRLQIMDCRLQISQDQSAICNLQSAIPLFAAALVAFNPQFLFVSGLASNDALLAALGAVALWLCVRPTTEDRRPTTDDRERFVQAVWLGVVLGLALLTKQSALVFVPMMMLATVQWGNLKRGLTARRLLVSLSPCLLVCTTAALISGWWYVRNWQLYGDPLGLALFQGEFRTQPFDFASAEAWRDGLIQLHHSFWARFGWMNVAPPSWVFTLFIAIELVAAIGWLRPLARSQRTKGNGQWTLLIVLVATTFAWLIAFARTAGLVAWQGRLLFPAVSAIAILLAAGASSIVQSVELRVKSKRWLFFTLHFTLFTLAAWLPFGVIGPAYPAQVLPERMAIERLGTPVYGRFGLPGDPGAELRGYTLRGEIRPAAMLDLLLIWHARGRQNRDWTVFVHVVGAEGEIVAESNSQPRDGLFPTGQWVAGDWIEDTHTLALPTNLAPGSYTLRVGLFDANTQQRTGVWDRAGQLVGDYVELRMKN